MVEKCECEAWILVDSAGDYAVGACPQSAREAYEEHVQSLSEAEGFRLVKIVVQVPLPEIVELTGEAPAQGEAELKQVG